MVNLKAIFIVGVLVSLIFVISGCCGATGAASPAESKTNDYQGFYGQNVDVSSTFSLRFDKYGERLDSDGTKVVTLTFTVSNSGTEQADVENGLFISDEAGRNFEANPFLCSTLINPGLSKKIDCSFTDVPQDSKIVALKLGDSAFNKGKYTTLMTFQ